MLNRPHQHLDNLYLQHHDWLCNWLGRRTQNPHSAADLAQDTFVHLLAHSSRGKSAEPIREPRSYLATIARRIMIDHFRRQRLEQSWLQLQSREEREEASPEVKEVIIETLCEIDAALARSDVKVRQTFVMFQLEGLSYAEIAHRLHVSISSVKKYMARAVECCLLIKLETMGALA